MAPRTKALFSLGLLLASAASASASAHVRSGSRHRLFARQQSADQSDPAATGDASTGSLLEAIIPAECSQACQPLVQATDACADGADLTCACTVETVRAFVTCATCAPVIHETEGGGPYSLRTAVEQALQQCQAAGSPVDYDPSQVSDSTVSPVGDGSASATDSLASNSVDDSSSSSSSSLTLIEPSTAASSGATLISPTTLASSPAAGIGARPITSTASVPPISTGAGNAAQTAADNAGGAIATVKLQSGLVVGMVLAASAALACML